jgi:predicted DNA-binding protein (MmcQ/YjbR family)
MTLINRRLAVIDTKVLRAYCIGKPGAVEELPFGPETLVFKVGGKMFALMPLDTKNEPLTINLKCDPTLAQILRNTYDAVQPGYHMNKTHWNTVTIDGSIPNHEIYEMVDHSYSAIVKSLKKAERLRIENIED